MKKLALIVTALLVSTNAGAESLKSRSYVGGNIANLSYSETTISDDLSLWSGYARFGAQFEDYVSLEWRIGTGLQDDEVNIFGSRVDANLDMFYGAYLLGAIPISKSIYPYALIGYTKGKMELNGDGLTIESEESDVSFGVGININLPHNFAINAEYTRYLKKKGVEVSGPTAGFIYYF